jgi:hypothetical protein
LVGLLLQHAAKPLIPNNASLTPLKLALSFRGTDYRVLKLLLEKQASAKFRFSDFSLQEEWKCSTDRIKLSIRDGLSWGNLDRDYEAATIYAGDLATLKMLHHVVRCSSLVIVLGDGTWRSYLIKTEQAMSSERMVTVTVEEHAGRACVVWISERCELWSIQNGKEMRVKEPGLVV